MEEWRPVPGFDAYYEVSSFGRIKSLRSRNEGQRTLTPKQVEEIRDLSAKGISDRKIALRFGMSQTVISKILRGVAYKDSTRILVPALRRDGYLFVTLSINNKHFHRTIHSMVAEAFIGNRPVGRFVNHKDANRQNNSASNLEYVSRAGNHAHARYETGIRSHKLTLNQATDIWYAKQRGERRKTVADRHGISVHMVSAIWMGKSWWHAR